MYYPRARINSTPLGHMSIEESNVSQEVILSAIIIVL